MTHKSESRTIRNLALLSHVRRMVHHVRMSQETSGDRIPALTLGWRMRMSLDYANISVQQMATQLGVSRTTLSRWMADKGERPKRAYISQWALSTGVPFEWIAEGKMPSGPDDPDGDGARQPSSLGGSPTGQKVALLHNQLVHLPRLGLAAAHSDLLRSANLHRKPMTQASTGLAA